MRDVEEQLRIYGDSILDGEDVATVSAAPRRRSLVFASAAIVVIAALAGALLVVGEDQRDQSAVRTVPRSPETKHRGPKVTAELHLDKNVVHRGEDVTGTVVFENRTGRKFVAGYPNSQCLPRWVAWIGRTRKLGIPAQTTDCPNESSARVMVLQPGTTRVPLVLPSTYVSCGEPESPRCPRDGQKPPTSAPLLPKQHTKVWLSAGGINVGRPQALQITGPPRVPFCHAADVAVTDSGPADGSSDARQVHRFLVRTVSRRPCQLEGAPQVWVLIVGGAPIDPTTQTGVFPPALPPPSGPGASVVLRRSASAAFLVQIRRASNAVARCKPLRIRVVLPNQGGRVDLSSDLDQLCISKITVVSNFTPSSSKRAPEMGGPVSGRLDRQQRDASRRAMNSFG